VFKLDCLSSGRLIHVAFRLFNAHSGLTSGRWGSLARLSIPTYHSRHTTGGVMTGSELHVKARRSTLTGYGHAPDPIRQHHALNVVDTRVNP
jgi:hypothetical protein